MNADDTLSFTDMTTNKDADTIDQAIEGMLLDLELSNIQRDLIAKRFFEYGFEFAIPEEQGNKTQFITWMAVLDSVIHRAQSLRDEIDEALAHTTH